MPINHSIMAMSIEQACISLLKRLPIISSELKNITIALNASIKSPMVRTQRDPNRFIATVHTLRNCLKHGKIRSITAIRGGPR